MSYTSVYSLKFGHMSKRRNRANKTFENVPVVDAGAKGKSVAKTEDAP